MNEVSTVTIDQLIAESQEYDSHKTDYRSQWKPDFVQGKMMMVQGNQNVGPYYIQGRALSQICSRLGKATFGDGTAKQLPREAFRIWLDNSTFAPHASALLNDHVDKVDPHWFVRTYKDDARAVLTEKYADISNTSILEQLATAFRLVEEKADHRINVQIYRSGVTPDDLHLHYRILGADVLPPGEKGPYAFGGVVQNGECGDLRLKMLPAIYTGVCTNTIVIDDGTDVSVNMRHYGSNVILQDRVAIAIAHSVELGTTYLNKLIATKEVEIPDLFTKITKIAEQENWSVELADAVRTGTDGNLNLFGLLNGMTYAAHRVYGDKPREMMEMEMKAGSWMMNPPRIALPSIWPTNFPNPYPAVRQEE